MSLDGSAKIIPIRPECAPGRSCDGCEHAYFGQYGIYCIDVHEFVDATAAQDCPCYSPIDTDPTSAA